MSVINFTGIDHVVIRARDLEAMVSFYENVLGCAVERRADGIGLVQLRAGTSLVDLVDVEGELGRKGGAAPGADGHNMDHFCVRVLPFDPDTILAHLAAHDVEADPPPRRYGAEGFGPSIYLRDPEGNTVELKGPPEPPP